MIGLGAAFLVLLAAHRRPGRAVAVVTPEARGTGVRRAVAAASGEALARDAARGRRAGGRRQVTAATAGFQRPEVGDLAGAELVLSVGEVALVRRELAAPVVEARAHSGFGNIRLRPELLRPVRETAGVTLVAARVEAADLGLLEQLGALPHALLRRLWRRLARVRAAPVELAAGDPSGEGRRGRRHTARGGVARHVQQGSGEGGGHCVWRGGDVGCSKALRAARA
mmetsp:Transcript_12737/g.36603  ORF Transcript_12737/g.36603 Transcript_12737/m.36603 type:complete len:226 (-) Transcript_12737:7-684(-)